jgi:hypothetical protein
MLVNNLRKSFLSHLADKIGQNVVGHIETLFLAIEELIPCPNKTFFWGSKNIDGNCIHGESPTKYIVIGFIHAPTKDTVAP